MVDFQFYLDYFTELILPRTIEILSKPTLFKSLLFLRKKHKDELRKKKIQNIKRKIKYRELKYKNKLRNFFARFIFWKKLKTE